MRTSMRNYLERGLAIGLMTFTCAMLAMFLALFVMYLRLDPNDSAQDEPFLLFFVGPLMLWVALPIALGVALLAFPTALLFLVHTNLNRSVPIALVATCIGTVLGGLATPILGSALGGLVCGELGMLWCRFNLAEADSAESIPFKST